VDDYAFLLQRFVERDEAASVEGIGPAQDKDAEVFVGEWAGDGEGIQVHGLNFNGKGGTSAVLGTERSSHLIVAI